MARLKTCPELPNQPYVNPKETPHESALDSRHHRHRRQYFCIAGHLRQLQLRRPPDEGGEGNLFDSQMASLYFNEFNGQPRAAWPAIRGEQTAWLRARNGCGANVGCLNAKYRQRITSLSGIGY
jgi:hypothetical protein